MNPFRHRGTKGLLTIEFIELTEAAELFAAADELTACLAAVAEEVVADISGHAVSVTVTLPYGSSLTYLLESIEAQCPTIAKGGSASAGRFVTAL